MTESKRRLNQSQKHSDHFKMKTTNKSRRTFLKQSGLVGTGLIIGFSLDKADKLFASPKTYAEHELTPFIRIDNKGIVTLVNTNPDMGQGSTQAIPTLIAEELEVTLDQVKIIPSDGQNKYGSQISGGSGSVRRGWEPLRKAGAAAREMLVKAAAATWKAPLAECYAENGFVIHKKTNKKLGYGDLIEVASQYEIPQNPTLKSPKDFKLIGKPAKRLDVNLKVQGKAVYGIDVDVPGKVVACILHSPSIHSKVVSIDDTETKKVEGVIDVIRCERTMPHRKSEAVAVIASNYWSARQGRKVLNVQWEKDKENLDTDDYFRRMNEAAGEQGAVYADHNDFQKHFNTASNKLDVIYETPFLCHAPLEPENATVHVKSDGTAEVWAPVQGPDWARNDVSKYLNIIPENVKINITFLGGSFGRKAYLDFVLEACFLSKQLMKPVQVIWSREDDIAQGPYRGGMVSHMQGTVGSNKILGFHHHAIGETLNGQIHNSLKPGTADPGLCGEIDFKNSKYNFDFSEISFTRVVTNIPISWWRSVYASNFGWGQECFLDELAHLAHIDPIEARMTALSDDRYKNVLSVLATKADYYTKPNPGSARGIAMWKSFESICAACITVSKTNNGVHIDKVVSVIDCGLYVNPDMVKAQTEGNIIMGLSAAIKDGITYRNGMCEQNNFHQYQILRLPETPEIEVHIVESQLSPGGVGEPGLPPIAPALGNAIFNLTGKRIRKLPIKLSEL
jgi:isoquinoline 1-oxidoreductase subunit beta